jgi:hypothetical protein
MSGRKSAHRLRPEATESPIERAEDGSLPSPKSSSSLSDVLGSLKPLSKKDRMPEITDDDLIALEP